MELEHKYCSDAEKTKPENKDKIVISNESMAILEGLEEIKSILLFKK